MDGFLYVHDGLVEEYPGTFDEFLWHLAQQRARAEKGEAEPTDAGALVKGAPMPKASPDGRTPSSASSKLSGAGSGKQAPAAAAPAPPKSKEDKARDREADRAAQKKRRELEKKVSEYEQRIAQLETEQASRSAELSKPEVYADQALYGRLLAAFTEDQKKLEELMLRWEQAGADLAAL